jgi:OmpA family
MTDPTSDVYNEHQPPEDKNWIIPVLLLVGGVVLAGLLIWWIWDTFQASTKDPAPTASPTVSGAPATPTFAVLFNPGETTLDEQDQATIANAEKELDKADSLNSLHIIGRADATGVPEENQAIAQARADVVKNDLIADGYKTVKITITTEVAPKGGTSDQNFRTTDIVLQK